MPAYAIGVIGCGRISAVYRVALQAMEKEGIVQVRCAMDKDKARAEAFAGAFSQCAATEDFDEVLSAGLDAVHILTPHFLHAEQTIACLQAGLHVLCEKPIAIHMEDAARMIAAEKASGKQLGIIYQNRYIRGIRKAKELLQQGVLGNITGAWSSLNWWRPPSYYDCDWKGSWEKEGGGVVIDQAIHSMDLVRYLMDCEAVSVKGNIDNRILKNVEVEDVANAAIRFANGAVYVFSACNYFTSNAPIQIEISCEKGSIHLVGDDVTFTIEGQAPYTVAADDGRDNNGESYWGRCHELQIRDYYDCLTNGKPVPFRPQDAKKTLALVQGIYYSAYTGKTCLVPQDVPPRGLRYL